MHAVLWWSLGTLLDRNQGFSGSRKPSEGCNGPSGPYWIKTNGPIADEEGRDPRHDPDQKKNCSALISESNTKTPAEKPCLDARTETPKGWIR